MNRSALRPIPDGLRLRFEAGPGDGEAVRRIVTATGAFRPDEVDVAVELVDERLARGAASGYEFVFAEVGGQAVGYSCFGPIACTVGSYDLYWIAVTPGEHRRGIGAALLAESERAIAAAQGRHIYVETSSTPRYAAARSFYERHHYERIATFTDFYEPGDSKVVYRKVTRPEPLR